MRIWIRIALLIVLFYGTVRVAIAQKTPTYSAETRQHIRDVVAGLTPTVAVKDDPHSVHTLSERMEMWHVPGVSIAVIHHGAIEWAQGFGLVSMGGAPVNAETLFQAGSISKPLAAMATLRLVQQGKLSLDADVNTELTSWKLPDAPVAAGKFVTLRELLTHTGGTTVHGFPGYAADTAVPTLLQVLNGEKPANTAAIRIEAQPGSKWNYSGGGYTIVQQLVVDVTKEPFPKVLRDTVLAPIGMKHSTYEQPLPVDGRARAATPYEGNGTAVAGGAHTYPEMAAAGLWTTPSDLCLYELEVERSLKGKANHVLSQAMTKEMLTAGMGKWGLGLQIGGADSNPYFGHGGVNAGFESVMEAYENDGEGAVVMTNAQGGSRLADEVIRSIAKVYHWPDFQPKVRTTVKVEEKILDTYAGTYELRPNFDLVVTVKDGQLITQATGQDSVPLLAESETKFFPTLFDAQIVFIKDGQGKVTSLVLRQGGQEIKGLRK
ncbi:MAG TPA: serine hydrolase [Edaphobacter sp.]|nr:serine hydrolase [Edaphobacter sp.]